MLKIKKKMFELLFYHDTLDVNLQHIYVYIYIYLYIKTAAPQELTGAHLYLDIAKSGYIFHGYFGGMQRFIRSRFWMKITRVIYFFILDWIVCC